MHKALYRKWRPQIFDDICGQNHITDILKYEVANGKHSHAYLFCGSRGTGKTTCAKVLAKALNCESPVNGNPCNACAACRAIDAGTATDVLEMDAASNTSVDNVRDIKEEIVFLPADLRYRVYIIDEVHMLSVSAFNALLKTLEEPPAHVVFILATTELQKLPATIISRCQRFDFRRISTETIMARLALIAKGEGIRLTEGAARTLARLAQGGMRDAISLFELCAGLSTSVDEDLVRSTLGIESRENVETTVRAIAAKDYSTLYRLVDTVFMSSRDIAVFFRDLAEYYRDMMTMKTTPDARSYCDLTANEAETLEENQKLFELSTLIYHSSCIEEALLSMQRAGLDRRSVATLALTRMCDARLSVSPESLVSRLEKLEKDIAAIRMGSVSTAPTAPPSDNSAFLKPMSASPAKHTSPIKENDMSQASNASDTLSPLPSFSDIVEAVGKARPQILRFLQTATAYRRIDGACVILAKPGLGASILRRPDNLAAIRVAAAEILGDTAVGDIVVETAVSPSTGTSASGELETTLSELNSNP